MILVCPACGTRNKVPEERLQEAPLCGRCSAELMSTQPTSLTDANFQAYVAGTDLPVLVDFWADWCGPCQSMAPHFASAAAQLPQVRFAKVDTDANPLASAQHQVRSIPTLILFHRGLEVSRRSGALPAGELVRWAQIELARAGA